jgi:hypothetical protein
MTSNQIHEIMLAKMAELRDDIRDVRRDVSALRDDVVTLKSRAKVWGSIVGFGAGLVAALVVKLASLTH